MSYIFVPVIRCTRPYFSIQTFNEKKKDLTKNYNVSETVEELELSSKDIHISEEKLDAVVEEDNSSEEMKEIKSFFANN